jgi:hypothetical protein
VVGQATLHNASTGHRTAQTTSSTGSCASPSSQRLNLSQFKLDDVGMEDAPDIEEVLDGRGMESLSQLWTRGIRNGQHEFTAQSQLGIFWFDALNFFLIGMSQSFPL